MLLKIGQVKNITFKKRIKPMSTHHLALPWTLKIGFLGLALSVSPVCMGDAFAQSAQPEPSLPAVKAPNPADEAPDPYTDPLDKDAASHIPEGRVTVHSIDGALEAAYRNNSEMKELQAQVRAADEGVPQAMAGWRPTVFANAAVNGQKDILSGDVKNGDSGQSFPANGRNTSVANANLEVNQNLFNGGKTVHSTCKAESIVQAARAQLADKEREILFNAVQAYFNVIAKTAELEYRKSNETSLKGTLEATQAKYDVGEETLTAIAQSRASLADGRAQREAAEAALLTAEGVFEQVTGARPGKLTKPGEPTSLPAGLKEAIEIAKKNNPAILAALHQEKADRSAIKESNADLLPKVDLQGRLTRTIQNQKSYLTSSRIHNADFTSSQAVSVNMRVPLYEGGSIRGRTRQLRETAEQNRIKIETARRKITQQLVEAWETYLAAKANVENYKIQVKSNETALEGTRQEMLVGSKILLDVLNAQQVLVNSQLNLVKAEQSYYQSAYSILANTGRLNALDLKLKVKRYDPRVHYHDVRNCW
jgi:outer membrane protein